MKQMKLPPPGSPEAVSLGCRCTRMGNNHGKGYMGIEGVYVYSGSCKLHMPEMQQKEQELDDKLNSFNRDCSDAADEFEHSK